MMHEHKRLPEQVNQLTMRQLKVFFMSKEQVENMGWSLPQSKKGKEFWQKRLESSAMNIVLGRRWDA